LETLQAQIHRPDVVHDLTNIGREGFIQKPCFSGEEILERALSAFDLARQDCFPTDIHVYEKVWVRQGQDRTIEASQLAVCFGQKLLEFCSDLNRRNRRKCRWDERTISAWLPDVSTGSFT
jgi:hypothetical protein